MLNFFILIVFFLYMLYIKYGNSAFYIFFGLLNCFVSHFLIHYVCIPFEDIFPSVYTDRALAGILYILFPTIIYIGIVNISDLQKKHFFKVLAYLIIYQSCFLAAFIIIIPLAFIHHYQLYIFFNCIIFFVCKNQNYKRYFEDTFLQSLIYYFTFVDVLIVLFGVYFTFVFNI